MTNVSILHMPSLSERARSNRAIGLLGTHQSPAYDLYAFFLFASSSCRDSSTGLEIPPVLILAFPDPPRGGIIVPAIWAAVELTPDAAAESRCCPWKGERSSRGE
jgi:hypothetical protein